MRLWVRNLTLVIVCAYTAIASAEEPLRVLFLSKSSTFVHPSIKRNGDELGKIEQVMLELGNEKGWDVEVTKDAGKITADNLATLDAVVFYTTGDLTVSGEGLGLFGGDGNPPMSDTGLDELLAWIRAGGGFVGYHCASDTFHSTPEAVSPYIDMLGGEFVVHGRQFVGSVRVVEPDHPANGDFPDGWTHREEWYTFKNYDPDGIRVIAVLEPGEERGKQKMYDVPAYPIVWCRSYGEGRVFYNAIGHRLEIWDDEAFRGSVTAAIGWAAGAGETRTEPNFNDVVNAAEHHTRAGE